MVKAARAQGSPTMVSAMMSAAKSQPAAIQRPPKMIQSRFRAMLIVGMGASRVSAAEIAELAVQLEIAGGDLRFHLAEPRLEIAKLHLEALHRIGGRSVDAAPELLLLAAAVERARLRPQHHRQNHVGRQRRREEEDEAEHGDQPRHDRLDADIVGDPGANAGDDAAIGVAPEAVAVA